MAKGYFAATGGHRYSVEFTGNGVSSRSLDIVSATVGVEPGDRKFVGYKSTTAVIGIATDEPMVELYAAGARDIKVVIKDETTGKSQFIGYVVPFVFEQPFTGTADVFTVNAVDVLTAAKGLRYISVNDDDRHGVDETGYDIIGHVRSLAGAKDITRVVYHINFGKPMTSTLLDPLDLKVAQAGFLQDAMSVLDVLSAVCMFFGYTSCLVGDTLYLYDEHCLVNAPSEQRREVIVETITDAGRERTRYSYNSAGNPLRRITLDDMAVHNDITLSVERAYDGVQITPSGSDVSVLCPDVCGSEEADINDNSLGTETRMYQQFDPDDNEFGYVDFSQWRTPLSSKVMDLGYSSANGPTDWPSGGDKMHPENGGNNSWEAGAILMDYTTQNRVRYSVDGVITIFPDSEKSGRILWLRINTANMFVADQWKDRRYSHTRGFAKITMTWRVVRRDIFPDLDHPNQDDGFGVIRILQLKVGDQYYRSDYTVDNLAKWGNTPGAEFITNKGKMLPTLTAATLRKAEVIVRIPNDGHIGLSIQNTGAASTAGSDIYIESLSVEAVGDDINLRDRDMYHEFKSSPVDVLEVQTNLTSRGVGIVDYPVYGVNARPSVVTSEEWSAPYMYMGDSKAIPVSGVLMEQLRARYGEPRLRYAMTVEGEIFPSDVLSWLGDDYTVEGYERDLVNNTTTITIN